ncbi:hypothetical protein TIFTF001_028140 [Ficus carica]|uniref:Uncharacterized protein n=1 Tax=Ficus carica TaxID=3494 RepID=A0AA88IZR2_FICCA|nr:hypothetical protein TIFTF001_028140 [Ficus carica]
MGDWRRLHLQFWKIRRGRFFGYRPNGKQQNRSPAEKIFDGPVRQPPASATILRRFSLAASIGALGYRRSSVVLNNPSCHIFI